MEHTFSETCASQAQFNSFFTLRYTDYTHEELVEMAQTLQLQKARLNLKYSEKVIQIIYLQRMIKQLKKRLRKLKFPKKTGIEVTLLKEKKQ